MMPELHFLFVMICHSMALKDEETPTVAQPYLFNISLTTSPNKTNSNLTTHLNISDSLNSTEKRISTSDQPVTTSKGLVEHDLVQFKGCFEFLKFIPVIWEDGLFTKALDRNTKHECFAWCSYLSDSEYFAISKELCYCFNKTMPEDYKANISYCGRACGSSETCNGSSSYVGIFRVFVSQTVFDPATCVRNVSRKRNNTLTLKKDIFIVLSTVVASFILVLMCAIVILIKRRKKLQENLDTIQSMIVEQATSIEVLDDDDSNYEMPPLTEDPTIFNNSIYNDTSPYEDIA